MADYYVDLDGNISKKKKKKNDYSVSSSGKVIQNKIEDDDIAPVKKTIASVNDIAPVYDSPAADAGATIGNWISNLLRGDKNDEVVKNTVKDDGITPVKEDAPWYKSGVFSDGYDFGDVTKHILGVDDKKTRSRFTGIVNDKDDAEQILSTMSSSEIAEKKKTAKTGEESRYYDDLSIQKQVSEIEEKLSKVTLENGSTLLEEVHAVADMEDGKEKKARKKALEEQMLKANVNPDMWYSMLTGDKNITWTTAKKFASNAFHKGLNAFNTSLTGFLDLTVGGVLKGLGWEDNPISKMDDYYENLYDSYSHNLELTKARMGAGGWADGVGNLTESTVAALPQALMAIATMGGSTATSLSTTAAQASGTILQNAGITAQQLVKNPQYWLSFVSTYEDNYEDAKKNGADDLTAGFSATITSLTNAGIETGSGIDVLPDRLAGKGSKAITEWVKSSLEEGGEEVVQGIISNAVARGLYDSDREIINPGEMIQQFGMGAAVGGILGGGQIGVTSAVNTGANVVEKYQSKQLTENEQKVVNKVYEDTVAEKEKNGKLTTKEKNKIYNDVVKQMERGYIDTDTIESVLGGESYEGYKSLTEQETSIKDEIEALENTPENQFTVKQRERLTELREQLKGIDTKTAKSNLFSEVDRLTVNDTKLRESYNEKTRRGQAFEADLTKYDAKQQETIKKAVESGILNNTNRTHEFVDLVAIISADKGVPFDFTNNQKLKESGFAIDGKQVNGFVTKDGVTVNVNSAKSLNTVVGQEITHVLDGTDLGTELQTAVIEYAKSKNDYQGRYDALAKLYENTEGANIDSALTSELVGDYLLADTDFIHNLSTNHKNVFQKVYDEIKYLLKVAAPGSKEAKQLERAEDAFSEAANIKTEANPTAVQTDADITQKSSPIISKLTGREISQKTYETLDRLGRGEAVTLDELNSLPEVVEGSEKVKEDTDKFIAEHPEFKDVPRKELGTHLINSAEREQLRNSILKERLESGSFTHIDNDGKEVYNGSVEKGRRLDIVIGLPAAGKSTSVVLPLSQHYKSVVIDSDIVKEKLPEFNEGWGASIVHEESSNINAELFDKVTQTGSNIVLPIVGAKPSSIDKYLVLAKDQGYDVYLHLNELNSSKAMGRNLGRYFSQGRFIPPEIAWKYGDKPTEVYEEVKNRGDISGYSHWNNDVQRGQRPTLIDISGNLRVYGEYSNSWRASRGENSEGSIGASSQGTDANSGNGVGRLQGRLATDDRTGRNSVQSPVLSKVVRLTPKTEEALNKSGVVSLELIDSSGDSNAFSIALDSARKSDADHGWAVTPKSAEELVENNVRTIMTSDGGAGLGVAPDGDIEAVFKNQNSGLARVLDTLMPAALEMGGNKLDCYGEDLVRVYAKYGFVPVARLTFNPEYANPGWTTEKGTPDIFFMMHNGDSADAVASNIGKYKTWTREELDALPLFGKEAYDDAYAYRDSKLPQAEVAPVRNDVASSEDYAPGESLEEQLAKADESLDSLDAETEALFRDLSEQKISDEEFAEKWKDLDKRFTQARQEQERLSAEMTDINNRKYESLDDSDIPPEAEAPYYGDAESIAPVDPFAGRDMFEVGKRNVKAYMHENPEVKPFFQDAARGMLYDLHNGTKGERIFNEQVHYETGYEKGWMGTKRRTTGDIADLLDQWNYTYDQIEAGLNAIIEDNGKENNAVSKRIEFMLDNRLRNGYRDVDGRPIPSDAEYINLLKEKQIDEYRKEGFDSFMETADQYAPPEDIAPLKVEPAIEGEQNVLDGFEQTEQVQAEQAPIEQVQTEQEKAPERLTRAKLHSQIIDRIKSVFTGKGIDFDKVLDDAHRMNALSINDNTPQRVNDKTFGYDAGEALNELTFNKVALNESEGVKWLNKQVETIRKLSKQYKIKPRSKESAAAQMYAEGFWVNEKDEIIAYGDAELAQDFPDVQVQNRIKALASDPAIRSFYDNTLSAINESRKRNAYPEIPRLENYYLHFRAMDDTFSRLGIPFNPNDIKAKDLPTDINGTTIDRKPGQPFFTSAMHREGKRTSFDLLGGLEKYANSAKNQIYHIDDIQTARALWGYIADRYGQAHGLENLDHMELEAQAEHIQKVYDGHLSNYARFLNEYANNLAGKTALIDRGVEGLIGRRALQFINTVNTQTGRNQIGYSISSPLTNFIPSMEAIARTSKRDSIKAFAQTVSNVFRKDGFVENDPTLIRRKGADRFTKTLWEKMSDPGYILMGAVDNVTSEFIVRTKYNELTRKGMDSKQAHIKAGEWASRVMGDRSLGQMPLLYNSKFMGLFTKYQLEVRNQLDSAFYDNIQEVKASTKDIENQLAKNAKTATKIASKTLQIAVLNHAFGMAFEKIAGYNPAFDIISTIATLFGWDDEEDDEDTFGDNAEQAFKELLGDLPYTSLLTDGGRIPIGSAMPIKQLITGVDKYGNEKSRLETVAEAAPYYLLPGGYSQIKKTASGLGMFSDEHPVSGSYTDSGNLRFPVEKTFGNVLQAGLFGQYASENARDYFDNERSPLKEKQIQEYLDVDIPIKDYWEYREGLAKQKTNEDKVDYIDSLDLPLSKKNILVNNVLDRKEPVDLEGYENFSSLEEFDFATKNPGKYAVSQVIGDYSSYTTINDFINDLEADKDEEGKSITGSRKNKVFSYIDSLPLDYGQKCILFKSYYKAEDSINMDIVEYLDSREDIGYEEMVTILSELGFTVNGNNVYWD